MPTLLLGLAALLILIWAMYGFARVDPKKLVPAVKTGGGIGALAGAAFLAIRCRLEIRCRARLHPCRSYAGR